MLKLRRGDNPIHHEIEDYIQSKTEIGILSGAVYKQQQRITALLFGKGALRFWASLYSVKVRMWERVMEPEIKRICPEILIYLGDMDEDKKTYTVVDLKIFAANPPEAPESLGWPEPPELPEP